MRSQSRASAPPQASAPARAVGRMSSGEGAPSRHAGKGSSSRQGGELVTPRGGEAVAPGGGKVVAPWRRVEGKGRRAGEERPS
nr:unnamed protein product [Digitaria exilis]